MSQQEVIHAYRHLYRNLLHAVRFHPRARINARDQLRTAFREKNATFNPTGIQRTIWFLKAAVKERGLEHKILKNLLKTAHLRSRRMAWKTHLNVMNNGGTQDTSAKITSRSYDHYDMTVALLNKTMGLCLR